MLGISLLGPNYFNLWKLDFLTGVINWLSVHAVRLDPTTAYDLLGWSTVFTVKHKAMSHSCVSLPPCCQLISLFRTCPHSLYTSEVTVLIRRGRQALYDYKKENKALQIQTWGPEFRYSIHKSQAVWTQHWMGRQDEPEMLNSRFSERSRLKKKKSFGDQRHK